MITIKKLLLLSLIFPLTAEAQLTLTLVSRKSTIQTSARESTYTGGTLTITLTDGSFLISPCVFNGTQFGPDPLTQSLVPFPPSTLPPCVLGTTAYITSGDIDLDGLSDIGEWWSLAQAPTEAVLVAPNYSHKVTVVSSPPSLFPRPGIFPVVDSGFSAWYDVLTGVNQRFYQTAGYRYDQSFAATPAGRRRHDETVVTGSYIFGFPSLTDPDYSQHYVRIDKLPLPEAYPGLYQSPIDWGFRFTNDTWNDATQAIEFDPRTVTTITWEGVDLTNSLPTQDEVRFWIRNGQLPDPTAMPPVGGPFDPLIVYPPAGVPYRFQPLEMYNNYVEIPPNLMNTQMGVPLVMYFRVDRNFNATTSTGFAITDASVRVFAVNIMFIDTYDGYTIQAFPPETSEELRDPDSDYDGDGSSNLVEFALGSDPIDLASTPAPLGVAVNLAGNTEVTVPKRANVGASILYEVEYSTDMTVWTKVDADNPDWSIDIDDAAQLVVSSNAPLPVGPFFVRAAITLRN